MWCLRRSLHVASEFSGESCKPICKVCCSAAHTPSVALDASPSDLHQNRDTLPLVITFLCMHTGKIAKEGVHTRWGSEADEDRSIHATLRSPRTCI